MSLRIHLSVGRRSVTLSASYGAERHKPMSRGLHQSVIFKYQKTGQQLLCAAYVILPLTAHTGAMDHQVFAFSFCMQFVNL